LGAAAWHRPRTRNDGPSSYKAFPDLPVPQPSLELLALELQPQREPAGLPDDALRPLLTEEVGYTVVGRNTAGIVFAAFLVALLAPGIGLGRSGRPEIGGWRGPAAAIVASGVFVALGEGSRRAVPATAGVAEVVEAVPGSSEAAVRGTFGIYRPGS